MCDPPVEVFKRRIQSCPENPVLFFHFQQTVSCASNKGQFKAFMRPDKGASVP
jgi:hypothetical protein